MTTEEQKLRKFLIETWAVFEEKFYPGPDWIRPPLLLSPSNAVSYQERIGLPADARWQIVVCKLTPDSEHPDEPASGGGIQAVLPFADLDELVNTPLGLLARRLALSIAARTYHDMLDWITLDGELAVNPHGTPGEIEEAVAFVREYLGDGTTRA